MAYVLAVPIRLDALRLVTPLSVVEAKADFTRMPYWDGVGAREVNPDVANISEELVSYPFQDSALVLPPGVHLHWALPDALTRGSSRTTEGHGQQMLFPAAPNRWLVSRSVNGETDKQWLVESDYLYPNNYEVPVSDGKSLRSVAIPFPCDRAKGERPFRYLGRKRLLKPEEGGAPEQTPAGGGGAPEYLSTKGYRLTAVGYQVDPSETSASPGGLGEPTFAALYPNCLSVFGLHDPEPLDDTKATKYQVVGWYSKPGHDCLSSILPASIKPSAAAAADTPDEALKAFERALKKAYGWETGDTPAGLPTGTIFHASIDVGTEPTGPPRRSAAVTAAVGNTVTEALSAYLANAGLENTPADLEGQLEALHLADRIDHLTIDIGPKFQHARHDRGFSSVSGGTVWAVRVPSKTGDPGTQAEPLHEDVADLLNRLNIAQGEYDRAVDELDSLQKQLFADWYKYMLCAYPPDDARDDYPDVDEVRYFIEKNDLKVIENQIKKCVAAKGAVDERQKGLHDKLPDGPHELQPRPGTRYYRPHEPVLLIAGEGIRQTERHGQSGPLACAVPGQNVDLSDVASVDAIRGKLDGGANPAPAGTWHPFSLDWRVEMHPLKDGSNLDAADRAYDADFVTKNYQLGKDKVDLTQVGAGTVERAASVYTGSSLMTSHARLQLKERINAFLSKRLLKKYPAPLEPPGPRETDDYFESHFADIKRWYDGHKSDRAIGDPVVDTMLKVAEVIDSPDFHVLAQSLGGFNEALLMHKQTFQLPLDEPLGFEDARDFTRRVAGAVGRNTYVAPQPLNDFQPIRTGGFKVLALRLVDTFGRVQDLRVDRQVATEVMPQSASPDLFSLPPRLVQPARLSFQWLAGAAEGDEVEMNSHPAMTPICGWLLPNHLDNSLMVYDAKGRAQGSITADAGWLSAPGAADIAKEELPAHLKELVTHLTGLKATGVQTFFGEVEAALENINPAGAPQHDAPALLVGRPLAVVRARLRLELRGTAALNQGWDAFRSDVARCLRDEEAGKAESLKRTSDGLTRVRFPVRLGDSRQLNDGLLGYWVENRAAPRYADYRSGNESTTELAADDGAVTLTMLVDPRGVVHLTSGILPAEVLEIPHEHYEAALKAIEVTFLAAPILSPAGRINLPLPAEPEPAWSWVGRRKNEKGESEWRKPAGIGPADTQAGWDESLEIHDGWLRLTESPAAPGETIPSRGD